MYKRQVPKSPYFIEDLDNDNPGYGKDRYFSYTWDTFLIIYTHTRKYPPGKQKFGGLCPITLEPLVLEISYIPHWKALIFSFLEV